MPDTELRLGFRFEYKALAVALVDGYAGRRAFPRTYRGGLGPVRLRRIKELVQTKIEDNLTLHEMAREVELSTAHFSQMFRKSTGQSPHQFVLHDRVERAKEMLRSAEMRVLVVAVACGFKTQGSYSFNTPAVPLCNVLSIGPCPNLLWPQGAPMVAIQLKPKDEVNDLVLEQIYLFKQPANLTDAQLLEYHLRHLQIMTLYRKLDRAVRQERYTGSLA